MSLAGRSALVTGGGRGIGAATASALTLAGASVTVAARTSSEIERVAAELRSQGRNAFAFACDVTDAGQVERLVDDATDAMGRIDILVNNAGAAGSNPVGRTTLDEWNRMLAVNATSAFLCIRAVFDDMVAAGWGRIVNVASQAGLHGARYVSAYTAAKHAMVGLTRAVAAEAEGTGVTANAVCPGYVDTPLTDGTIARVTGLTGKSPEDALDAILRAAGQSRLIHPEEVATEIVALCDDRAAGRNGETVIIDIEAT